MVVPEKNSGVPVTIFFVLQLRSLLILIRFQFCWLQHWTTWFCKNKYSVRVAKGMHNHFLNSLNYNVTFLEGRKWQRNFVKLRHDEECKYFVIISNCSVRSVSFDLDKTVHCLCNANQMQFVSVRMKSGIRWFYKIYFSWRLT